MKTLQTFFAVCLAVCLADPAQAWGRDIHSIIATIAEQHLTPETQARVLELLDGQNLSDVASWADDIKPDRPETRSWHYLNPPVGAERVTYEHCPPEGCVLSMVRDTILVLNNLNASDAEQAEALRFLVHLSADLHTPLHVSREADRGGNDIPVEFQGESTNLHVLWDVYLLQGTGEPWQDTTQRLLDSITPRDIVAWSNLDPQVWATESFHLALDVAYPIPGSGRIEDDPDYTPRALAIIDRRMAQAGIRLALVLEQAFGQPQ